MANTDIKVDANTSLVIGAVVVAGGIIYLVYKVESDTVSGATQIYNDVKSAPGKVLDAIGSGLSSGYNAISRWISGSAQASQDFVEPQSSGPSEDSGDGEARIE